MVEQENQGQRYFASQQQMESVNQLNNLNSPAYDDWLTADISNFQEITNISMNLKQDSTDEKTQQYTGHEVQNSYLSIDSVQDPNEINATSTGFYESNNFEADMTLTKYDYLNGSPLPWNCFMDPHNFKLDDVFQVDKADLFQGPTLAELNANDESLFDSFDSFESCLPSENKASSFQFQSLNTFGFITELNDNCGELKEKVKPTHRCSIIFPVKENKLFSKSNADVLQDFSFGCSVTTASLNPAFDANKIKDSNKSIKDICTEDSKLQAVPASPENAKLILNPESSEKNCTKQRNVLTNNEELSSTSCQWKDHQHFLSLSNDGEIDSQDDNTDDDFVFSSDEDSDVSEHISHKRAVVGDCVSNKKPRYFWQYNIQAKGPKGPKMKTYDHSFVCDVNSVSFFVKVRRGDGNDLTPSPQKLYDIGMELQDLSSIINDLTPVNELPFNARPKSRKEKNKLASRACRLKKKAQHEANKLKLFGLQQEYDSLMHILSESKKILKNKINNVESHISCNEGIEALLTLKDNKKVAGCTAEFVNEILSNVEAGNPTGGLCNL